MKDNTRALVRAALRGTDGKTVYALAAAMNKDPAIVYRALRAMPDAYIDRWVPALRGGYKYAAVWCVVDVPPNCPRPEA